jgi:ATP synthase protein I
MKKKMESSPIDVAKLKQKNAEKNKGTGFLKALSQIGHIGVVLAVCVLIGVFMGRFLDSLLGTSPWLLLLFSFFGVGAAFKHLYDMAQKF